MKALVYTRLPKTRYTNYLSNTAGHLSAECDISIVELQFDNRRQREGSFELHYVYTSRTWSGRVHVQDILPAVPRGGLHQLRVARGAARQRRHAARRRAAHPQHGLPAGRTQRTHCLHFIENNKVFYE